MTGEIPADLGDLPNLDVLHLSQNRLTGCIPNGLQRVTNNDFSELGLPFCEVGSAPEFPAEETGERSVAENTGAGIPIGDPVQATSSGTALTYTLGGDDAGSFGIDQASGQITTKAALDRETKDEYSVTVRAEDPSGLTDTIDVTITVTDVNEPPEGVNDVGFGYEENGTTAVTTFTATDPEGDAFTWSLEGNDAGAFEISAGGELTFGNPPDYEAATDTGTDNLYEVTVVADDGVSLLESIWDVTVTIIDVDEAPVLTGNATISYADGGIDPVGTYTAIDPEGASLTWSLSGDDDDDFSITGGVLAFVAAPDMDAPTDADTDNVYEVTVEISDSTNTASITVTVTVTEEATPTLLERYDDDNSGEIEKSEVFTAINEYLDGGTTAPTKAEVFRLINLYLGD